MSTNATSRRTKAPWGTIVAVIVGVAIILSALFLLMLRGQEQGTTALDLVKAHTETALAQERARLDARGQSLEVVWSTVPMPRGDGDTVVSRLETRPSGTSREAAFMVMGNQVTAQNGLARRLLAAGSVGSSGVMTMEDGTQMPMPEMSP